MNLITRIGIISAAGAALALTSCSTGGVSPSGFLSNYKQLDGGYGTANAVSAYVKPGADLKKYDSVIIDPVTTIISTPGIDPKVTDQLAAYLVRALRSESSANLKIVGMPGPTTLRVRAALTDVIEGEKSGAAMTRIHSDARAALTGDLGSDSVAAFVSKVSFEGEIVDSVTGERLLANIDHREGDKRNFTAKTPWIKVRDKVDSGVARLYKNVMKLRAN